VTRRPKVAVIGAGAGGIAMGIALKRAGFEFTIYEKSDGVGGTWRDNTYPGAACDVPSHLYSYSFEPHPWWSRTYATQPEILAYLERCTDQYGIRQHLRPLTAISEARWDASTRTWALTGSTGEKFSADVVVSGLGMLNVPHTPVIEGAERFRGSSFHSSQWDHSASLSGKRVASIGTGASAIQYVPAIAPEAEQVLVFQRSPIWITPRVDKAYSPEQQHLFAKFPLVARLHRFGIWRTYQRGNPRADSEQTVMMTELARSYLARKIEDPTLREALTPDYPVGCKRPLISRNWFPALLLPNVRLITEPIVEIIEKGLRTADGESHEVDTIIYGTGFKANEYLSTIDVIGESGHHLHETWKEGAEAYLGLSVPGYPNFFMLYGPNTNGMTSIIFILEAQVHFIMGALRAMRRLGIGALDVRPRPTARYNEQIQSKMDRSVWTAGCTNYFRTPSGKVVTQLPYSGARYWARTRIFPIWCYRASRHSHTASPKIDEPILTSRGTSAPPAPGGDRSGTPAGPAC
jgi:cyclohexanone monooxygenase